MQNRLNANALEFVDRMWLQCDKCELSEARRNVVSWGGSSGARLAVIGDPPGEAEDASGRPFFGRDGEEFDEMCSEASATGPEPWSCFVVNIVGCRTSGGAAPTYSQWQACRPRLLAMLATVRPAVVLLVGSTALSLLAGKTNVLRSRGTWTQVEFEWRRRRVAIPAMPTLHPAYILRNKALRSMAVNDIRRAWERAQPGSWVEGERE